MQLFAIIILSILLMSISPIVWWSWRRAAKDTDFALISFWITALGIGGIITILNILAKWIQALNQ